MNRDTIIFEARVLATKIRNNRTRISFKDKNALYLYNNLISGCITYLNEVHAALSSNNIPLAQDCLLKAQESYSAYIW